MFSLRRSLLRAARCTTVALALWGTAMPTTVNADAPPLATELEWEGEAGWPLAVPRKSPNLAIVGKDDNVVFELAKDEKSSWVQRVRFHRNVVWKHVLPDEWLAEASLLVGKDAVFVVHYCVISSGATVHAIELATGKKRWSTPVQGLGPIDHSKYSNHVVLKLVRGYVVAYGNEAQGRYIEVFDPQTGKMLSTRKLPAARPG